MVMKRYQGMKVVPRLNPSVPKNVVMLGVSLGSQTFNAKPIMASIRPMVTTSCATSGASHIRRMRTRSTSAPNNGAATSTVSPTATSVFHPRWTLNSQ